MRNRRVLLVDDDDLIRELVATTLGLGQFSIVMADDGPSGIETAIRERPELVILDVAMPGMDGVEVCTQLRLDERTRGATIVMLTARATDADKERAMKAGADAYVVKPFSPLSLMRLIDKLTTRA